MCVKHDHHSSFIMSSPSATYQFDENNQYYDVEAGVEELNNNINHEENINYNNNTDMPILNNITYTFNNMINPINIISYYYDNNTHYSIQNQNMILPITTPPPSQNVDNNDIVIVTPIENNVLEQ